MPIALVLLQTSVPILSFYPQFPRQGEIVVIQVALPEAEEVWVRWQGRKIPAYPVGKRWRTFLGISSHLTPRGYPIHIFWRREGKEQSLTVRLQVRSGRSLKRRLRLPKEKRRLFLSPRVKAEKALWRKRLLTETPKPLWDGGFLVPVRGRITTPFGVRRLYVGLKRSFSVHRGVDIAAPKGTPVKAANSGRVLLARRFTLEGNAVLIDHGQGILTAYFHLSALAVREGQRVVKGQKIGAVGSSGVAKGAHLHWSFYVHGIPVDPMKARLVFARLEKPQNPQGKG